MADKDFYEILGVSKNANNDEIKKSNGKQSSHAAHQNTPDARSMMGRYRAQVPAKLRRFT